MHADTILPENGLLYIAHLFNLPDVIGGGFNKEWEWDQHVNITSFIDMVIYYWSGLGNWLVDLFQVFPGDNAIFVRKDVFENLGGFAPMWICEDFDFTYRLRRYAKSHSNHKIVSIPFRVKTSARRFEQYGVLKVINWWLWMYFLWRLGWSQEKMRLFFDRYSLGHDAPVKSNIII